MRVGGGGMRSLNFVVDSGEGNGPRRMSSPLWQNPARLNAGEPATVGVWGCVGVWACGCVGVWVCGGVGVCGGLWGWGAGGCGCVGVLRGPRGAHTVHNPSPPSLPSTMDIKKKFRSEKKRFSAKKMRFQRNQKSKEKVIRMLKTVNGSESCFFKWPSKK